MALPYVPPGVTITEAVTPQVVPLISSTAELVVIGLSAGHETRTDQFIINKGTNEETHKLPFLEQLPGSKLVKIVSVYSAVNPAEPSGSKGKGFAKYASGPKTGDWEEKETENVGSIKSVGTGALAEHENYLINVTYEYTPADYYNPIRMFGFGEVQHRFGNALTEEGAINSFLSLGAQKAFENGARSVICQPLLHTSSGAIEYNSAGLITNATQPTIKQNAERGTWETSLQALNSVEAIDLLTPIIGQSMTEVTDTVEAEVFNAVLGYELQRAEEQQYVFGVFGEDGTGKEGGGILAIRNHAAALRAFAGGRFASSNALLNVSNFAIQLPSKAATINVGGQYAAAGVAGALASRPASVSLTRKGIIGFQSVNDLRIPSAKNEDAEAGLMVIEQVKGGFIRCRHSITLDNSHGSARREVSVIRAKFNMIESIRDTLENQIIGQIIADANSPLIVRSAIAGVLSALVQGGEIVSYEAPVCRIATLEPATITASFSYRPAFTLNNINITFALDLTSQTVSVTEQSGT